MANIIFYEKPGCINNTKQKALLQSAGHTLEVHNLLTTVWTRDELWAFLGDRPLCDWFNRTAPLIKSGELNPDNLDAETALALMVETPILIKRPLMQVGDRRMVGFDVAAVDAWIGLEPATSEQRETRDRLIQQDLQTCPSQT